MTTYKPFDNARNDRTHHLWLFCENCGLHAFTHSGSMCEPFDPGMRFERKSNQPSVSLYEWCKNCGKHVRHHYGDEQRCQPRPVESPAMGDNQSIFNRPADAPKDDPVNPKHYRGDLVMRIIEHFGLEENFYLGNVIKYILRHAQKAGIEDLKKARWYLDRAIARLEGKHQEGVK